VRNTELIEDARDDEIDEVADRLGAAVESGRRRQDDGAGARELEKVFEVDCGRRSLSITSAARSIKLSARPAASAPAVPMLQGQIAIASAGFEPEAMGESQSSRPNTVNCPAFA